MNCIEFEQLAQTLMDQRGLLKGHPALDKHAAECRQCAGQLALYSQLTEYMECLFENQPPTALSDRGQSRFLPLIRTPCVPNRLVRWQDNAVAVGILLLLGMVATWPLIFRSATNDFVPRAGVDHLKSTQLVDWLDMPLASDQGSHLATAVPADWASLVRVDEESVAVLRSCYRLTSELPGVRTLEGTVNAAWSLFMRKMSDRNDDLEPVPEPSAPGPHSSWRDTTLLRNYV